MTKLTRSIQVAVGAAAVLAAVAATATGATDARSAGTAELRFPAAHRRRAALHRRPRRVRRRTSTGPSSWRSMLQNAALKKAGLDEGVGSARRLGGRPDAGVRLGRGRDEAHQGEQGERDHRRDGVERHDPDGAIGDHPEQRRPRSRPTSSAPQITDAQGQRATSSGRIPPTRSRARCSPRPRSTQFGKGATLNVGARNDAFGTALQAALRRRSGRGSAARSATNISWNPDQANFDTEAAKLVDGQPGGVGRSSTSPTRSRSSRRRSSAAGKWSASKTLDDRGAPERRGARRRSATR